MNRRRTAPAFGLSLAGVVLAIATACGVGDEGSPRFEAAEDVPYGLLETTTTTTASSVGGPATAQACLVGPDDRLAPVERAVPARATVDDVLAALGQGPTAAESRLGVSTAVPDDPFAAEPSVGGGVVTVDLAPGFADVEGRRQLVAVAQVVCTLTARPGIGQVAFTLDGVAVEVPRGNGSATSEPVSRDDYPRLIGS